MVQNMHWKIPCGKQLGFDWESAACSMFRIMNGYDIIPYLPIFFNVKHGSKHALKNTLWEPFGM